jgi:hypothetical protein
LAKFSFWETLRAEGAVASKFGLLQDRDCYYRTVGNDVQAGVRATFDRWANSTDFTFSPPRTVKAYARLMSRLREAIERGDYNRAGGEPRRL